MPGSLLGNRVRRVEDPDLLTGKGAYVGDLDVEGVAHCVFVRSPHAHARVRSVQLDAAREAAGVVAVLAAGDLGVEPYHGFMVLNEACARPPLARDKVRFTGEPVALVVAESEAAALDAAELVEVDYEPLTPAVDALAALLAKEPGALQFEEIGSNVVASTTFRSSERDPFEGATHVVRAELENQRVAVMPMEGDAILAVPRRDGDPFELTVYVSTQMPHDFKATLAKVFGLEPESVRVVAPFVGGAFGAKAGLAAEHASVVAAARLLGRPLSWVETRSENLLAMPHGRGQRQWVEVGFDDAGRITGLRCRVLADAGAYAGFGGALALGPTRMMAQGVYKIPVVHYDAAVVVTNTTPMGAFRGAGRPEAAELLERVMDVAADELALDPVELRRRNLIARFSEPYETVMGTTYDNGDYERALDMALERSGYEELRGEQEARRRDGARFQLGIGVAVYVEITGFGGTEFGAVEVHPDGSATIRVGTSGHGQGHATSFAMLVSDTLGIPLESITFVQSDTAVVPRGEGTGGSRSLQLGGNAVLKAAGVVLEQAKQVAADELEASAEDIVVHQSGLGVAGVPSRTVSWPELVAASPRPLLAELDFEQIGATFPFGAHVAVVEVDMETGFVRPVRHVAVDDCGRILNPLIVSGQQHGGVGQGLAQALYEEMVFDDVGNPLTGSLADYCMPSAAELPFITALNTETPTPVNPLGAKGIGESGTIGSTPAVHNAVVDALSHLGVRHVAMPCSPERVWRAIEAARTGGPEKEGGGRPLWSEPPQAFEEIAAAGSGEEPEAAQAQI